MNKLQEACIISHGHWIESIDKSLDPNLKIPNIKIPHKENKIIDIKDLEGKSKKKFIKSQVVRIILIASVLFALLMSVCAFSPFKDFVVEFFEDHNLFTSDSDKVNYPKEIDVSYVPEGFALVKEESDSLGIFQEYSSNNKSFAITKNSPTADFQISNTYTEEVVFYNEGVKYTFMQLKETVNIVVWLTEDYSYSITGYNMTKEEMIKISKNIK